MSLVRLVFCLIFPAFLFFSLNIHAQNILLWEEDFETNGDSSRYLASNKFRDTCNDHFNRTDGSNVCISSGTCAGTTAYSGFQGAYFWAAEDQDDIGSGGDTLKVKSIVFNALDVSHYDNLRFTGLFAAGNACGNNASTYDASDYLRIYYQLDGGIWELGLAFESESNGGDETNEPLAEDTDFDGIGNGAELVPAFAPFGFAIPYSKSLRIRVETHFDADKEEGAFDYFQLKGDTLICTGPDVPVVGSTGETGCPYSPLTLKVVSGQLNSATQWVWYEGSCGGKEAGAGDSLIVSPSTAISYFVRGEGYCVSPGPCAEAALSVADTVPPQIICLQDTTVMVSQTCEAVVPDLIQTVIADDNCGRGLTFSQTPAAGVPLSNDTIVHLMVQDTLGNLSECDVSVALSDTLPPVLTCLPGQEAFMGEYCKALVPDFVPQISVSDNCGSITDIIQTPPAGGPVSKETLVTIAATDQFGNTGICQFVLTPVDTVRPVFDCPGQLVLPLGENCNAIAPDLVQDIVVSDNCRGGTSLDQSIMAGTELTAPTTIVITATDSAGNVSKCEVKVVLEDQTVPLITCPGPQVLETPGLIPDYTALGLIDDNCEVGINITQAPAPGSVPMTPLEVALIATDLAGNTDTCSFPVEVITGTLLPDEHDDILYPNPVINLLTVRRQSGRQMMIFDLWGRKYLDLQINGPAEVVNMKGWPSGFYFIHISGIRGGRGIKILKK